ncbi:MAG TPA: HD-GYP domain-containing protein [Accumulibacter sp.]|uniref:HD-GYP domain-containing protein n=1 Tax=Accumulibacter sp. TaxID=2053492 RepID=UPI002B9ADE7E|nr:HD-GYP domain-containing protein [Accumulibacter sp.]HMW57925.1 HD-GYP domain-containing protein [Accumulibacter sp.]
MNNQTIRPRLSSVHRKLIFRLTLAAALLSAILGTAAFLYEQLQLQKQIAEMARIGIEVLRQEVDRQLAIQTGSVEPGRHIMDDLARKPLQTELGRFPFVALYDAKHLEINHVTDASSEDVLLFQEILGSMQPGHTPTRMELGKVLRLGKSHGLPFVVAIDDEQGRNIAFVKGFFMPSAKTEADILHTARRASVLAIVFVVITALFIYPIIRGLITGLERQSVRLAYANFDTIKVLGSAIAKRDSDTDIHNYRVTIYSIRLGEAVGLDEKHMRSLIKGAFLHDVGKIAIRDKILLKPGRLDTEEFVEMQSHVQHGLDILAHSSWLSDAAQVVGCHHEKFDGSGYPSHLAGEDIPISARIFAVADVFDALTSARPYKPALTIEQALNVLRGGAGHHFDPVLVSLFEPLAPSLHAAISRQMGALDQTLDGMVQRYFTNLREEELNYAVNVL